ncbi:MAG: PPC domain-containing protein [Planctomycetes bacterium]|nr:PPC domain-containing protein [Planctomycetota bacterium]
MVRIGCFCRGRGSHRVPPIACLAVAIVTLTAQSASAGGNPFLRDVVPRGAQRGTETVVELTGDRLDAALAVLFHDPGITVTQLEQVDAGRVRCTFAIDPHCTIGLVRLRIRTAHGLSNLKLFSVGNLVETTEAEPNGDRKTPQAVELPITINGTITSEDVDLFAFEAQAGQVIAVEIEAMRLGDTLFDPRLALYDADGRELIAVDDTPLLQQDAALIVTAPTDGRYVVEVRETAYGGNGSSRYRLHMGSFPRPLAAFPAGGQQGTQLQVTWIGDATAIAQTVDLPSEAGSTFAVLPVVGDATAPSAVPFHVTPYATIIESEPNNDHEHATAMTAPGGASGVIGEEGDVDCYVFDGQKDQRWEARIFARRLGSPLDSVIQVRRHQGGGLAGNDDSAGPDSVARFTCPEDGRYVIEVRDLLAAGGAEFTYFLELAPIEAKLTLTMKPPQAAVAVPQGNRRAILITARRQDFGGPLTVTPLGLPAGVVAHVDTMHESVSQLPMVFEAQSDAGVAGALVDFVGRHADTTRNIEGRLEQTIELVKFENLPMRTIQVDRLALAVTEPAPFRVTIVEPKVPIVRRGAMDLPIKLERADGFDGEIEMRLIWNPPGIGSGSLRLSGDQTEGVIHLNAGNGARVGSWRIVVIATATVGGGAMEVSSQLAELRVADPYLDLAIQKARVELGQSVALTVNVTHNKPVEGQATVQLLGLPNKVVALNQPPSIGVGTETLTYDLRVDAAAPPGRHTGLFVRAVVIENGEPIVHLSTRGELFIDKPLPPKDPEAEAKRAEAKRKAAEARAQKKAERIAAAKKRRAEREAKRNADAATAPVTNPQ